MIFDCDGVLIDSEAIACGADAEALTAHGYPITAEELARRFAGVPGAEMYRLIEEDMGRPLPEGLRDDVKQTIMEKYRTELQPIPGAEEVLATLNLPKCVASSSAPAKLALGLVETGLYELVYPHIHSAVLVPRGKPHPDLFLYSAQTMGVAPEACLVIEDSVAGVTAAKAAGIPCIGFTGASHCGPDQADRLIAAGAMRVVNRLPEILEEFSV